MSEDEVPEERFRAAEVARPTLPAAEAAAKASDTLRALVAEADNLAMQHSEVTRIAAAADGAVRSFDAQADDFERARSSIGFDAAEASKALRSSISFQVTEFERARSSIGIQAAGFGALRSSIASFIGAQLETPLRSVLDFQTAQISGTLRQVADLHAAQIRTIGSSVSAIVGAQVGSSLSLITDGWRMQLSVPLPSLGAFELAHAQLAMQSVLPDILAEYAVQPETGPLVAVADAGAATDTVTVTVDEPTRHAPARTTEIVTMALVVLLLLAIDLTLLEMRLSPEQREVFKDLIENIGFILAVASICRDIRKH